MIRAVEIFSVVLMFSAHQSIGACLAYGPTMVTVSGKLKEQIFPGRPNFEDVRNGDEPEKGFYLQLSTPVCTAGDASSGIAYPQENVSTVQLILDPTGYAAFSPFLGKGISIRGTLLAAHTGHHHAPLLIEHASLTSGNAR